MALGVSQNSGFAMRGVPLLGSILGSRGGVKARGKRIHR
jgi:hypothetical protein